LDTVQQVSAMYPGPIHHWVISRRVNMPKINTGYRGQHEPKTIK